MANVWELWGVNHKVMPDNKTMALPDNETASRAVATRSLVDS